VSSLIEAFSADCASESQLSISFRQVVFWFYTPSPSVVLTAIFCSPTIELWNVTVTIDPTTTSVTSLTPRQQIQNVSSITGPPGNGRAYNGVEFDGNFQQDTFSQQRQNATQVQLPAAVIQVGTQSGQFSQQRFRDLTETVYVRFASLFFPLLCPMNLL
jgi:hypothetical protein